MVFPTFFNLSLNLAIRNSWSEPQSTQWSCFCWLYRVSSSLATKNIINLISVLTIWWCPCIESFLVLLDKGVCYDINSLLLIAFANIFFPSIGCLSILLMVFFTMWKFLSLIRPNLFMFTFLSFDLGDRAKIYHCNFWHLLFTKQCFRS